MSLTRSSFDVDAVMRSVLSQLKLPNESAVGGFELGEDANHYPAVWIWIVVDDANCSPTWLSNEAPKIRNLIHDTFIAEGLDRWPYVRFETSSEWSDEPFTGKTL